MIVPFPLNVTVYAFAWFLFSHVHVCYAPQFPPFLPCHQAPTHPAGPLLEVQYLLLPTQCLASHYLQGQLEQLNISQRRCNTNQSAQSALHRATAWVLFLSNSGNSFHMSSFGGPSPTQQPLVAQFMGVHQPILGASGTDTEIMESEPMPMACILSVSVSKVWHVTKKAMQELICCSSPAPSPVLL